MLACSHAFHTVCLREWASTSPTCPVCRRHTLPPRLQSMQSWLASSLQWRGDPPPTSWWEGVPFGHVCQDTVESISSRSVLQGFLAWMKHAPEWRKATVFREAMAGFTVDKRHDLVAGVLQAVHAHPAPSEQWLESPLYHGTLCTKILALRLWMAEIPPEVVCREYSVSEGVCKESMQAMVTCLTELNLTPLQYARCTRRAMVLHTACTLPVLLNGVPPGGMTDAVWKSWTAGRDMPYNLCACFSASTMSCSERDAPFHTSTACSIFGAVHDTFLASFICR